MAPSSDTKANNKVNGGNDAEGYMKSKFPVLFPSHAAFTASPADFDTFLRNELRRNNSEIARQPPVDASSNHEMTPDTTTRTVTDATTTAELRNAMNNFKMDNVEDQKDNTKGSDYKPAHPFMKGLAEHDNPVQPDMSNKMLTENADVAYRSTQNALVDVFSELEDVISGPRLLELLNHAWKEDSLATLKIIFNARSIHLGKSSRCTTYRCFGWLAKFHPLTLVNNLQWLSRPIIEKKAAKKAEGEDDLVMVEAEKDENDPSRFDVEHGVAHGYWKDLLNILALSANKKLNVLSDPKDVLNVQRPKDMKKRDINYNANDAKNRRRDTLDNRHSEAVSLFENDPVHRTLHITVARLVADQLKADLVRLRSGDAGARRYISLCAKWAPTQKLFHDKHTFVVSSIAEMMHPQSEYPGVANREIYLRRAREAYRKDFASLRKALEVVERDITAKTFKNIKYDHVPSIAMNNYAGLFAEKDTERFSNYIEKVAAGKKKISGAVLLPSKLIQAVRQSNGHYNPFNSTLARGTKRNSKGIAKTMIDQKMKQIDNKVIDGQWKALVKRIKDSGNLESSIAVCDVSGSMNHPIFSDGTCPLDSSIGLSLLLAEVTQPPFGGSFITFSSHPSVERIDLNATLQQKYNTLSRAHWSMNTNFVAVFEDLILPMAIKNKLKQEDMVKQIFVFSDMQFDQARTSDDKWTSSFERIQKRFQKAGYEMPKLIFWNLAGGRAGYYGEGSGGDSTAPKPVQHDQTGTALVSGYSQGMLKVFLDNGSFEEPEEEIEIVEAQTKVEAEGAAEDADEETLVEVKKKRKMDPLSTVKKAISHNGYSMLKVFD